MFITGSLAVCLLLQPSTYLCLQCYHLLRFGRRSTTQQRYVIDWKWPPVSLTPLACCDGFKKCRISRMQVQYIACTWAFSFGFPSIYLNGSFEISSTASWVFRGVWAKHEIPRTRVYMSLSGSACRSSRSISVIWSWTNGRRSSKERRETHGVCPDMESPPKSDY